MLSGGVEEINGESLLAAGQTCEGPWRFVNAPWLIGGDLFFLGLLADAASSRRASSCVDSGKQGLDGFEAELESSARDRGQGRRKIRTSGLDQKGFFGQQKTRQ